MKKRLLAILLVVVLLLAFSACGKAGGSTGDKASAYASYQEFNNSMSREFEMDFKGTQVVMGQSVESSGTIKYKHVNGKDQIYMLMEMDLLGQKMEMIMLSDGTKAAYIVDGAKSDIEISEIMTQFDDTVSVPTFEESAIKSCEVTSEGDNTKYSMVLDKGSLTSVMDELKTSFAESMGDGIEVSLSDIPLILVVDKDNNPKTMIMDMSGKITGSGMSMDFTSKMEYTIKSLFNVSIDFSDLES